MWKIPSLYLFDTNPWHCSTKESCSNVAMDSQYITPGIEMALALVGVAREWIKNLTIYIFIIFFCILLKTWKNRQSN